MESANTRTIEASVFADLAVHKVLAGSEPQDVERIVDASALPDLARMKVNLTCFDTGNNPRLDTICDKIRRVYLHRMGGRAVVPKRPELSAVS